jgi:hypothetical protein
VPSTDAGAAGPDPAVPTARPRTSTAARGWDSEETLELRLPGGLPVPAPSAPFTTPVRPGRRALDHPIVGAGS